MLSVGARVGSYELVAELAEGGMAKLFLGRRSGPGGFARNVAVKVVHHALAEDRQFVEMFIDEARLSASIDHPNVVHVEELGEVDGQHYLVMEHVDGVTLSDVLRGLAARREPMPVALAVAIAAQVADGLHGAHEATDLGGHFLGLVHRDVSPQNVLLSSRGHVKLIDFGIAKARGRATLTQQGGLKGKVAYMAPEQATGGEVDRRTDVFALGVVLWEMLTLRRLFWSKKEHEVLERVREARVHPPSTADARVSPELDAVVLSALAKDASGRFANAYSFRKALLGAVPEARFVEPREIAELVRQTASEHLAARRDRMRTIGGDETVVDPSSPSSPETAPSPAHDDWAPPARPADALPGLEAEVAAARASEDPVVLARALGLYALALGFAGRLAEAWPLLAECDDLVRRRALGLRPRAMCWRGQLVALGGDLGARLTTEQEALRLYEEAGQSRRAAITALNLADIYNRVGDPVRAERLLVEAIVRGRQLDAGAMVGYGLVNLAYARILLGRIEEASANLDEAHRIGVEHGRSRLRLYAGVYRAELLLRCGRWSEAASTGETAAREAEELGQRFAAIAGWTVAARAQLAAGLFAPALERSARAMALRRETEALEEGEGELFLTHARALEANGEHDEGRRTRAEGRRRLMEIAERIADVETRRRFLHDVEAHRELVSG